MKAGSLHGAPRVGVLHEDIPDQTGAEILCHQHGDAEVDAENIGVIPVGCGMKCVHKAIPSPRMLAPLSAHREQHFDTFHGQEGQ